MSINVFAPVQSPVLTDACGEPHALAVEAHQRGRGRALSREAVRPHDGLVELLLQAREMPAAEVIIHGRPRWKAGGQTPPLAPRTADITHDINNLP